MADIIIQAVGYSPVAPVDVVASLPKPEMVKGSYEPIIYDRFSTNIMWTAIPGATSYRVFRDMAEYAVEAPFNMIYDAETQRDLIVWRDTNAWSNAQPLDSFYWVCGVANDATGGLIQGELSDACTLLHPFALRCIEEARSMIADDFRIFGAQATENPNVLQTTMEQVSAYNYKIALDQAVSDINSTPTPTNYGYGNFPGIWKNLATMGSLVYMLPRLIIFEQAKQMRFQDQGQEWTPPDISGILEKLKDMYKEMYDDRRIAIKHNVRPTPKAIGSLRALFISPQLLKFRHIPSGRPYFLWLLAPVAYCVAKKAISLLTFLSSVNIV